MPRRRAQCRYLSFLGEVLQSEECKLHEARQRIGGLLPSDDRLPGFHAQRHPQRVLGEAVTLPPLREFSTEHRSAPQWPRSFPPSHSCGDFVQELDVKFLDILV